MLEYNKIAKNPYHLNRYQNASLGKLGDWFDTGMESNQWKRDIREKEKETFQSYNSIIAVKNYKTGKTYLDFYYWDYSVTTGKYRNEFLGEGIAETRRKIKEKIYKLKNLNK